MSLQSRLARQLLRHTIKPVLKHYPCVKTFRKTMKWLAMFPAPVPRQVALRQMRIGGQPAEVLRPAGARAGCALLYIHGGGFVAGSAANYRPLTWRLAEGTKLTVHAVNYRLAPEHQFPAGIQDVLYAYRALRASGCRKLAVVGDSSGADFVLALTVALKLHHEELPDCLVCISPPAELAHEAPSLRRNEGSEALLCRIALVHLREAYLGNASPRDILASPIRADLSHLPPTLVQCGQNEMLRDYSLLMFRKLRRSGVDVTLQIWPEVFHVWHLAAPLVPESNRAIAAIAEFICRRLDLR